MPSCRPFQIEVDEDLDDLLERVQEEAAKQGVQFSGDTSEGRFSGSGVRGQYSVEGKIITISITDIGFPASMMHNCSTLEREIRRFFGG
jgi:hypothetical protein